MFLRLSAIRQPMHSALRRACTVTILLIAGTTLAKAAGASLTGTPLNDGYYDLYNLDFAGAHAQFQQWMSAHPEDPMGPASDAAAYIFTEFDRLGVLDIELFADDNRFESRERPQIDPVLKKGFNDRADQADRLADAALQRNANDATAYYVKAVTSGMRADWASLIDRHEYGAFKFSEDASKYAKQALALDPNLYDANLAVGIENYMLSLEASACPLDTGNDGGGHQQERGRPVAEADLRTGTLFSALCAADAGGGRASGRPQAAREGHSHRALAGVSEEHPVSAPDRPSSVEWTRRTAEIQH